MAKRKTAKTRTAKTATRKKAAKAAKAPAKKSPKRTPHQMKAYATFDLYHADQPPKNRTLIRALRAFVARSAPQLTESVKYGNGCWLNGKAPVAYVYSDEGYVQLGFFRGASLADPRRLLEGKGAYVRHVKVRAVGDVDEAAFAALLRQAAK